MQDYGLQVFGAGFVFHRDGRRRYVSHDGVIETVKWSRGTGGKRGGLAAFSHASRRRLEFLAANVAASFKTLMTLTYHGVTQAGEEDAARNLRIAKRSKRDLNAF